MNLIYSEDRQTILFLMKFWQRLLFKPVYQIAETGRAKNIVLLPTILLGY